MEKDNSNAYISPSSYNINIDIPSSQFYYHCPECSITDPPPDIEFLDDNKNIELKCSHNHKFKITPKNKADYFFKMTAKNPSNEVCINCGQKQNEQTKPFYYCFNCKEILCKNCKNIFDNFTTMHPQLDKKQDDNKSSNNNSNNNEKDLLSENEDLKQPGAKHYKHKICLFSQIHCLCKEHLKEYIGYCEDCNKNFCNDCTKHKKCRNFIYYNLIYPDKKLMKDFLNLISDNKKNLIKEEENVKEILEDIINKFNEYKRLIYTRIAFNETIIQTYVKVKYNYTLMKNVSEILKENYDWEYKFAIKNPMKIIDSAISEDNLSQSNKKSNEASSDRESKTDKDKESKKDNNKNNKHNKHKKKKNPEIQDLKNLNQILESITLNEFTVTVKIFDKDLPDKKYNNKLYNKLEFIDSKSNKANINTEIFFLCDVDNKNIKNVSFDELTEENTETFIDDEPIEFRKSYKFNKVGEYTIKFVLKEKLTLCTNMFHNCIYITEVNMSGFDTSKVKDMTDMFSNCFSLQKVYLDNFYTLKLKNISSMFKACTMLTEINLESIDSNNIINMNQIFDQCYSLEEIKCNQNFYNKIFVKEEIPSKVKVNVTL